MSEEPGARGRADALSELDALVRQGGARLVRGTVGVGKSALLTAFARRTCASNQTAPTVLQAHADPGESGFGYAVLHQLFDGRLFPPADSALRSALKTGTSENAHGDALIDTVHRECWDLVRVSTAHGPIVLLVDDVQWADAESARVLAFLARRCRGRRIALVLATREHAALPAELDTVPALSLAGLDAPACAAVLNDHGHHVPPEQENAIRLLTGGNPLVLEESATRLDSASIAGTAPLPIHPPLGQRAAQRLAQPAEAFGERTRRLLLILAVQYQDDLRTALRAARRHGLGTDDLAPAERAGLLQPTEDQAGWSCALLPCAVARAAPTASRRRAHAALAAVTDADRHPEAHAWHRAGASETCDDSAAAELESAAVAMAHRGELTTAHETLCRAAALAEAPEARDRHITLAAEVAWLAGYPRYALDLLSGAGDSPGTPRVQAYAAIARAVIRGLTSSWSASWQVLPPELPAAELDDQHVAIRLLITALTAGWDSRQPDALLPVVRRLRELDDGWPSSKRDLVRGLTCLVEGRVDLDEAAQQALLELSSWLLPSDALHPKAWPPPVLPVLLGREQHYAQAFERFLHTEHSGAARGARAMVRLKLAGAQFAIGTWADAMTNASAAVDLADELGQRALVGDLALLLALINAARGDEEGCTAWLDRAVGGTGRTPAVGGWARGLAALSAGRPTEAFERLHALHTDPPRTLHESAVHRLSVVDEVEAASRIGAHDRIAALVADFEAWVRDGAPEWAHADLARCRALLAEDGAEAEDEHTRALQRAVRAGRTYPAARTRLGFAEWLRRHRRHREARGHLRIAAEEFDGLGAGAWAERARAELRAAGEAPDAKQPAGRADLTELTAQERQIAGLAARGLSNRQIGTALGLSPRTVGYHLYKLFPKLGITSRTQLAAMDLGV